MMEMLNREFFGKLGFELVTIVVGVLIALGVNEIRQNYAQKELAEAAFKSISAEIESNRKFLEDRIPYYLQMAKTLDSLGKESGFDKTPVSPGKIPGWRGVVPPVLSDAAWQTAIQSGALGKTEFARTTQLSKLYSFQAAYLRWIDLYLNALITHQLTTHSEYKNLFQEMGNTGKELTSFYSQLGEKIKSAN